MKKRKTLEDSILEFETFVYARKSRGAAERFVRVLDALPAELDRPRTKLWTRTAAALSALLSFPDFEFTDRIRTSLLLRRPTIRRLFEASAYGSGRHLAGVIGGRSDGTTSFSTTAQVDKFMTVCPGADVGAAVLESLAALPITSAAPLILSLLSDPPNDPVSIEWQTILALAGRLEEAVLDEATVELAVGAWPAAPACVAALFRRFLIANGAADSAATLAVDSLLHLVVAVDGEGGRADIEARTQPTGLSTLYRITFVTSGARGLVDNTLSMQALKPDILWIPTPDAAPWTLALSAIQSAPIQLAPDGPCTETDIAEAIVWLVDNARTLVAA